MSRFRSAGVTFSTVGGGKATTSTGLSGTLPPAGMNMGTWLTLKRSSSSTSSFLGRCSPSLAAKIPALPSLESIHNGVAIPWLSSFPKPSPSFQPIFCNILKPNPSAMGLCNTSAASLFMRLIWPLVAGSISRSPSLVTSLSSISLSSSFSRCRRSSCSWRSGAGFTWKVFREAFSCLRRSNSACKSSTLAGAATFSSVCTLTSSTTGLTTLAFFSGGRSEGVASSISLLAAAALGQAGASGIFKGLSGSASSSSSASAVPSASSVFNFLSAGVASTSPSRLGSEGAAAAGSDSSASSCSRRSRSSISSISTFSRFSASSISAFSLSSASAFSRSSISARSRSSASAFSRSSLAPSASDFSRSSVSPRSRSSACALSLSSSSARSRSSASACSACSRSRRSCSSASSNSRTSCSCCSRKDCWSAASFAMRSFCSLSSC
mmetsp:Transcript_51632/g.148025  ORF Transcript_51632/g.148025 Transcript_51632/m.148025 type:complete len:438 (-) Transcript_51632:581-1894(-)